MLVIRCNPYRAENLSRVFDTYPICRERAGQYRKSKRRSVSGAVILFQSATSLKESLLRCVLSHYFQCVCKCWSVVMTQLSCCSASCEWEVNVLRGPSFLTYLFSCLLTAGRNLESADRWNEWMEKKKEVNRSEVVQHVYCDLMPQGNILTLRDQTGTSVLHFRCAAVEIPFFFLVLSLYFSWMSKSLWTDWSTFRSPACRDSWVKIKSSLGRSPHS